LVAKWVTNLFIYFEKKAKVRKLALAVRSKIFRIGGDEFVILLPKWNSKEEAKMIAERI
jgi:GGDEF domain-containing protein